MKVSIDIEVVQWSSESRPAIRAIRERVFILEQGVPAELEWDEEDAAATHLLAHAPGGEPLATARMLIDGHIGRVAVLPEWRRRGIGSMLVIQCIAIGRERGLKQIWLDAQVTAIPLYEKLGFVAEGDEFLDAGIPHRRMRQQLG
ncbi:Predicted N-acyltransferase, GNAT family [Thiohalomonas denitrificans]|uniref:Predicted N-acyltransferase, GNAT family n=1 Tax=Thiohalomonas denitrificans TaxID=415747 RepID=A0A1G5QDH3_9GAMM|nr:Predicted N-acyltransferase, GNAT family [Thiohalomonas denitrificans]